MAVEPTFGQSLSTENTSSTSDYPGLLAEIENAIAAKNYKAALIKANVLHNEIAPVDTAKQIIVYRLLAEINHHLGNHHERDAFFEKQHALAHVTDINDGQVQMTTVNTKQHFKLC